MDHGSDPTLENLVNQIAHDVRNHAFTIGLQAEMGLRRSEGTPEVGVHFEAVLHQVDALKHYVEQLLLYGRPVRLTLTSVDAVALVGEQAKRLELAWDSATPRPKIEVRGEGTLRTGLWDAAALAQALAAVLDNAARSAAPPPPISVTVRGFDRYVTVEVRDAGGGIAPDVLAKLAVPMAVRRAGGAGLGIAISRKIAEAHGGRLELSSSAAGTTACITLPWEAQAERGTTDG